MTTATFLDLNVCEEIAKESAGSGRYINPSKLTDEKRLRFVGAGITGFSAWTTEGKPIRWEKKPEELPGNIAPNPYNGKVYASRFMAGVVYDYEAGDFKILEITQKTLMEQLFKFMKDEDYGQPTGYDVKISKTGEGDKTKYSLVAAPPKPLTTEIAKAHAELNCNLHALFDGEDPWADSVA